MFNLNFYKKKFRKILLPINKLLGRFFLELGRSKHQSGKSIPIKKKIINLDHRIESFFDKFKNFKKFNQNKKNFYLINSKLGVFITLIVILFFTYFFIPAFYKGRAQITFNKSDFKEIRYRHNIKRKNKVWFISKTLFLYQKFRHQI